MKSTIRGGLSAGLFVLALFLSGPVGHSYAAKPPALPPVRYVVQIWDWPVVGGLGDVNDINNLGQAVGYYDVPGLPRSAYFYDPFVDPDQAVDLNDFVAGRGVPAGWRIASGTGINDQGIVVGYLRPNDPTVFAQRGFVLDTNAETPAIVLLPNHGAWVNFYPANVNENGDVRAVYSENGLTYIYFFNLSDPSAPLFLNAPIYGSINTGSLNNPIGNRSAQIGGRLADGTPYRWTPGVQLETFAGLGIESVWDINDEGVLCGRAKRTVTTTSKGKTTTTTYQNPMRLTQPPVNYLTGVTNQDGVAINSSADVLIWNGILYRDDWGAFANYVDVNKLLTGSNAQLTVWFSTTNIGWDLMNNRGGSASAGQIAGRWIAPDRSYNRGFLLNPVLP